MSIKSTFVLSATTTAASIMKREDQDEALARAVAMVVSLQQVTAVTISERVVVTFFQGSH